MLPDGRRQILTFAFPGEFLGLQGSIANEMRHTLRVSTRQALGSVQPLSRPRLRHRLAREEQFIDEHLLNVGRRSALECTAFILLHLYRRAEAVELPKDRKVVFPFTQRPIADALGLWLVHTNKTLRRLYNMKVVRWQSHKFDILDWDRLAKIAVYEEPDSNPCPLI
jgi:CRP/FNR family transcriptional regulator